MNIDELPKSRKEAKETGAKYYYTGSPCSRGHVAPRKTKGCCIECMREDWTVDNAKRAEKPKSDASKAAGKRYYEKNRDAVIARAVARPTEDKRKYQRTYADKNPEVQKAMVSFRRRRFRKATPTWLTKEQKSAIKKLYLEAQKLTKLTGEQYEVDHIVPLISDEVCGLHVPWNLRVITKDENRKKSNKLEAK